MGKYPTYACSCCGYANGDMFHDYYYHLNKEPTDREVTEFEAYRKAWNILNDERKKAQEIISRRSVWPRTTVGRKHSDKTRAKISATKKKLTKGTI